MSVSFWQDRTKQNNSKEIFEEFDVTIIGGGIAGLSCAYWLEKYEPNLNIALLEKNEIGSGASGRNAGFVTCGSVEHFNRLIEKHGESKALEIWNFSKDNLKYLESEIIKPSKLDLFYKRSGSFSLASTEQEFTELNESACLMEKLGIKVETVNQQEIVKRQGVVNFVGGIKYLDDGSIHPIYLLDEIKSRLKTTNIFENSEVYRIENSGEDNIYSSKVNIKSSMLIYATNGYSKLLDPYFDSKIYPTRGQILATEPVASFMESPSYANFVLDYFRQLPTGEVIIGGFRQLQKDVEIGFSDETSEVIQKALEEFLLKYMPALKNKKITHRWSGIMGFSVDGDPIVGALPGANSHFFLGGFTAHGLGLAFHSAKCLVEEILAINNSSSIPAIINARRFH